MENLPPEILCKVLGYAYHRLATFLKEMNGVFSLRSVSRYTREVIDVSLLTDIHYLSRNLTHVIPLDIYELFKGLREFNSAVVGRNMNGKVLSSLANLRVLRLRKNTTIRDCDLLHLTRLEILDLTHSEGVTGSCLGALKNLTHLDLSYNYMVRDDAIASLVQLKILSLYSNPKITDKGVSKLTTLEVLNLHNSATVTAQGLSQMSHLTSLNISGQSVVIDSELSTLPCLPKLRTLSIAFNQQLYQWQSLRAASSLTTLYITPVSLLNDAAIELERHLKSKGVKFVAA